MLNLPAAPATAAAGVDLQVSLTQDAGSATAGADWTYHVKVTNLGDDAAGAYTVSLDLLSGTSLSSAVGCTDEGATVDCTSTGLASGADETFDVTLGIDPSVADGATLSPDATITAEFDADTDADNNTDLVLTTVQAISDLGFDYSALPAGTVGVPWIAGQDATLTAVVTNYGPSDAPDNTVTIGIPGGTSYVSDDSGCTGTGVLTCAGGVLAPNDPRTINVTVHVHSDEAEGANLGPINASVQTTGDESGDTHDNTGSLNPHVHRVANLGIVKSGPNGTSPIVIAGDPAGFNYSLAVSTSGPSDTGFTVHDTLMSGLTFENTGSDPACSAGGQTVTCGGSITGSGSPQSFTIHVSVAPNVGNGSILDNDATVAVPADGTTDPNSANNTTAGASTVHTTITARADLELSVGATAGNNVAGDPAGVDFTYTISTHGPSDNVGGFRIDDTLPAGFSFVSTGSNAACGGSSGRTIVCTDASSFPHNGAPRVLTLHAKIASSVLPGGYSDAASVTSTVTTDPNGANDTDTAGVTVINEADLTPTVAIVGTQPFVAGDTGGFSTTVRVDNGGFSDNHGGYTVNVPLPAGFVFVSGTDCAAAALNSFTCTNSTGLAATSHDTYTVALRIRSSVAGGGYTLSGTVASSGTTDPTSSNNTSSPASVSVITRADLALSIGGITYPSSQTAAWANANSSQNFVIFEYDVTNNGPSDAQSVSFSDTLPSGLSLIGACFGTATCTPNQPLPLSIGTLNGNDGSPTNQSTHIRVKATASDTLRSGPLNKTDSASVTSSTTDPGPSLNTRAETAIVWTVPSTPTSPEARPGNTNAFFLWKQAVISSANGGAAIDFFRPTVAGTGAPASVPDVLVGDSCGTSINQLVFCTGVSPLTNSNVYTFVVKSHNVVGFSDPTTGITTTPSLDASAQQIGNSNLSQKTGNTPNPTTSDKQITVQTFPTGTTGVGTILETSSSSTFCGGSKCVGQVVKTKLLDPTLPVGGVYTLTLLYDKSLIGGTGTKYTVFYVASDTAPTGQALKTCPNTITAAVVPCSVIKLGSGGANPALKIVVYTKDPDPGTGTRSYPLK